MKRTTLEAILGQIAGKRILVVGDLMLDEFLLGDVSRISPEAPVPVVQILDRRHATGGAGNTAANIVSLGGIAVLCGVVGDDHNAVLLREQLAGSGVLDSRIVVDKSRCTTTKTRIVAHGQQVVRVDHENGKPLASEVEEELIGAFADQIGSVDGYVLSDYAKGVASSLISKSLITAAKTAGKPIVVDPKGRDYRKYRGATVVTPNVLEARLATATDDWEDGDWLTLGQRLLQMLEGTAVLMTRGQHGMSLFRMQHHPLNIPTQARAVYDVTGAGDTVVSALAIALAGGVCLETALDFASLAAGIVVGKRGTAVVTRDELFAAVNSVATTSDTGAPDISLEENAASTTLSARAGLTPAELA